MGDVIPFKQRTLPPCLPATRSQGFELEAPVRASMRAGGDARAVLKAAGPLLTHASERFGFTVMADGLPIDPSRLGNALIALSKGLSLLTPDIRRRPLVTIGVYFGRPNFSWFEDGYDDESGLGVPDELEPEAFATFVRGRLKQHASG